MTATAPTPDPATLRRLAAECREDDRAMAQFEGHERAPWRTVESTALKHRNGPRYYVTCISADHACWSGDDMVAWSRLGIWTSEGVTEQAFAAGIARTRNNLPTLANALDAAAEMADDYTRVKEELSQTAADLDRAADARESHSLEIEIAREILGASRTESLKQAAERVKVNCAERARERDAARAEAERLRQQLAMATSSAPTADEIKRSAREVLDPLVEERDRLRAEVERLTVLVSISPDDLRDVLDENDRFRAAFDQALKTLRGDKPIVHSVMCTWCGQHWPKLDGESYETARKYTNAHAEQCPANDVRIERDQLRARVAEPEELHGAAAQAIDAPEGIGDQARRRIAELER